MHSVQFFIAWPIVQFDLCMPVLFAPRGVHRSSRSSILVRAWSSGSRREPSWKLAGPSGWLPKTVISLWELFADACHPRQVPLYQPEDTSETGGAQPDEVVGASEPSSSDPAMQPAVHAESLSTEPPGHLSESLAVAAEVAEVAESTETSQACERFRKIPMLPMLLFLHSCLL